MEFENSPEDAPVQGNNGSPLNLDHLLGIALLSSDSKDALRAFIQHGRTNKEDAARLFKFCHSTEFSWFDDEDNAITNNANSNSNSNNNNNNAAARVMESSDSTHMSASSSSSSQNPPTQPQTPTFTNNSSIGLEYHLPEDHDDVGLETFLLWLLGAHPVPIPHEKVKKLYDMSRLPGHGTDDGFKALINAASSASVGTKPAAPIAAPKMAESKSPNADIPHVEQHTAYPQGPLPQSYEQVQLSQLYQHPYGTNFISHLAQMNHSRPALPPSPSGASMPTTVQQGSAGAQQFVAPAALSLQDQKASLVSPVAVSQSMLRGDSGHRNTATSPSARPSSLLESSPTIAPQSSRQQSSGPQLIAQASPEPSEAAGSPTGDSGDKIKLICPISKDCSKSVESDNETNAYKYLIEHIRRVHPDNHVPHLPSTKESVEKMINVEVAVCTILVNGVSCDFRLAGQKGSRSPWRQALNHIRDAHPEKHQPGLAANKANFLAMMKGGPVVRCLLPSKEDGLPCPKICMGEKAYRSIIEHARRAHPDRYTKTPSSSKEGWLAILRHNRISTEDMERSVSDGSSPSGNSPSSQAQSLSPPRQLPITSMPLPMQTSAIASGNLQVPVSQIQVPGLVSADPDQVASPGGPREFVHPYMLQHEVDSMALYQQNGQAEPMAFDGQHGVVHVPFSAEHSSHNLAQHAHGRQLSMDGALKPYFGGTCDLPPSQLDPTLGRTLFPSMGDNIAETQTQFTHVHSSQYNGYQQRPITHSQAVQKQAYSFPGAESSTRKRGRDDTDGSNAEGQEPPSKKVSVRSQPAISIAIRQNPSHPAGIGGPIPPLTDESFGFYLEKLAGNHFGILIGSTVSAMTPRIRESFRDEFREELMRRWPSAHELAAAPPEEIMALMVPMELGREGEARLRDTLQTLAKDYVALPPTRDRRFGCENYPPGAKNNVTDGEVFEAEEKGLADESHALQASWEISHLTKQHIVIDAWRIFGRDVLLGRAQDWKGTGTTTGFEPEWKRVRPQDPVLRHFLGWLWMKEGIYWDALTGTRQPLPQLTRLAANVGRVHFHFEDRFFFRTFEDVYEPIDDSGTSPSMAVARHMLSGASMGDMGSAPHSISSGPYGFMDGLRSSNAFTQATTTQDTAPLTSTAPAPGDAGYPDFLGGFSLPTDGPDWTNSLSAFDASSLLMLDGGDSGLSGDWAQSLE